MNAGSVKTTRVDSSPTPGVSPPDAMHKITYKLTSEFDVTKGVGHTTLDRSINDGPWEPVRQYPSPRASASYATEREAQNALRRAMRADQAAATRLGLSVEIQVISTFFALPFVVGALLSHWLGWSMWLTTPIATVFLFATGILRINFTPHQ